jgi:hypothetical protein
MRTDAITTIPTFISDISDQPAKGIYSINPLDVGTYNFRWLAEVDGNPYDNFDVTFKVIVCGLTSVNVS